MKELENIEKSFKEKISLIKNLKELDQVRIEFLGKNGSVTQLFQLMKNIENDKKKEFGHKINLLKDFVTENIDSLKEKLILKEIEEKLITEKLDVTEPTRINIKGKIHPLNKVINDVKKILSNFGFAFEEGPEIEDDFHNFSALNIPQFHPAREMQDTFYLKNNFLLRTHTSNTQIRLMKNNQPPIRAFSVGKVYRKDFDQTHTPMFHQLEGFMVDKEVNMANLKWVIEEFLKEFFEVKEIELRFRPSFFPFTEPSAEVDINYKIENGVLKIGAGDKFMEILGCGMIHPNVLKNCEIDADLYQGFAFGIGIERIAMLKYGIKDLRMFFENDIEFLNHYGFSEL